MIDFLYGVGAICGPAVANPFLIEENVLVDGILVQVTRDDLLIVYPYSIIAVYGTLMAIVFAAAYLYQRIDKPHHSRTKEQIQLRQMSVVQVSPWTKLAAILTIATLLACANGMAMVLETYTISFVHKFGQRKSTGALMITVSWIIHTVLGVPAIFVIKAIGKTKTLLIEVLILASSGLVFLFLAQYSMLWVWVAIVLESVGNCCVFGCLMAYLEDYFPVTGRTTSIFLLSICIGDIVWPMLVGYFVEGNPAVFLYTMAACAFVILLVFILLLLLTKHYLEKDNFNSDQKEARKEKMAQCNAPDVVLTSVAKSAILVAVLKV